MVLKSKIFLFTKKKKVLKYQITTILTYLSGHFSDFFVVWSKYLITVYRNELVIMETRDMVFMLKICHCIPSKRT